MALLDEIRKIITSSPELLNLQKVWLVQGEVLDYHPDDDSVDVAFLHPYSGLRAIARHLPYPQVPGYAPTLPTSGMRVALAFEGGDLARPMIAFFYAPPGPRRQVGGQVPYLWGAL